MFKKKLGYTLVLLSFLFLFVPSFVLFDKLYRMILIIGNDKTNDLQISSPIIDFGGSAEGVALYIVSISIVGCLFLCTGIYIVLYTKNPQN